MKGTRPARSLPTVHLARYRESLHPTALHLHPVRHQIEHLHASRRVQFLIPLFCLL